MKKLLFVIFILLFSFSCKQKEKKPITGNLIAKIGNVYITSEDLEKGLPQFAYQLMGEEQRRQFFDYVIDLVLFSLAAEKEGIDKEPLMKERLLWARRMVLSDEYFKRKTQNVFVSQAEVDSFYKKYENDFLKEIEFVYFFAEKAADAEEIKRLLSSQVFSKILVDKILSKYNVNGDITSVNAGYLHLENALPFPKEIADALLNLPKGKVSDVISLQNPPSFAVVKILSTSPTKIPKQDILNNIRQYLQLTKILKIKDSLREELKKQFPVEIYSKAIK